MTKSMQGREPSDSDIDALLAYLGTLDFRPPVPPTESARRGGEVFKAKGCDSCHAAPDYTTPAVYIIGLESELDAYLATRTWQGCSGAYAIQERDDPFVRVTVGSVSNVIGLPMESLGRLLPMLVSGER